MIIIRDGTNSGNNLVIFFMELFLEGLIISGETKRVCANVANHKITAYVCYRRRDL